MQHSGEEERSLLRDSIRGQLMHEWLADKAIGNQTDRAALDSIWRKLAAQGFTQLGADPDVGGLAELLVLVEELGRAACPVPLMDAYLSNLALAVVSRALAVFQSVIKRLDARRGTAWLFICNDGR